MLIMPAVTIMLKICQHKIPNYCYNYITEIIVIDIVIYLYNLLHFYIPQEKEKGHLLP